MTVMEEKQVIVKRQQEEFSRLMQTQVGHLHRQVDRQRWAVRAEGMVRQVASGKAGS